MHGQTWAFERSLFTQRMYFMLRFQIMQYIYNTISFEKRFEHTKNVLGKIYLEQKPATVQHLPSVETK